MVISPRYDGLKVLAVRLTEAGRKEIEQYYGDAQAITVAPATEDIQAIKRQYVLDKLNASPTKFYY